MRAFANLVDNLNRWAGYVAAFLLVPLTIITAYEVFMRYIVQRPTIWSWDLNIQLFAAIIMLGGGDTLRRKGHVVMDVAVQNLSPRKRALLEMSTMVILLFGVMVLLWGGWDQAWLSLKAGETMPTVWAPPYYTMKMMIPLGALLVLLQGIADFYRNLLVFKNCIGGD